MWLKLKSFLFEAGGQPSAEDGKHTLDELHIAATALLVEAAMLDDDELDENERKVIAGVCCKTFDIDPDAVHTLIEEAATRQKNAVDIHGFIKGFLPHFDQAERIQLLEMLWEVVYADGKLHDYEANLMRRICGLLGVSDYDNGDARKRVLGRLAGQGMMPATG